MGMSAKISEGMIATRRLNLFHLRVERKGAPRVLLLGGSNFDLRLKRSFLETPIAQRCDIATYEPRGIGRSDQPDGVWSMQDYASDALAFLDTLGWEQAVVLGESFGGMTALHLALLAPSRLRGLVVASATAGGAQHKSYDISEFLALNRIEAARQAMFLQDLRLRAKQVSDPNGFEKQWQARIQFETMFADPSILSGGYARLLAARNCHDCSADLSRITTPTTVIAGRFDRQAHPRSQRALAEALPDAEFAEFDAGHGVLFMHPEAGETALNAIQTAWNGADQLAPVAK